MGYGLVAVPRLLWSSADIKAQQRMLYSAAGQQAEAALNSRRCAFRQLGREESRERERASCEWLAG